MATETINVIETVSVNMENITSLQLTCVPVLSAKNFKFKRFDRECRVNLRQVSAGAEQSLLISRQELKRIKQRLANNYGRAIVITKEQVISLKAKRATRHLPLEQQHFNEVVGTNWFYEVLPPPFAKIQEQRAEKEALRGKAL